MTDIKTHHEKLVKGELNKFPFNETLYECFEWVYKFSMIRHEHYALTWDFGLEEDLDSIALFSLIINKHDAKAKQIIDEYILNQKEIDFEPILSILKPEWVSSASENMCRILLSSFPNDTTIKYLVSNWSMMSDYKYSFDKGDNLSVNYYVGGKIYFLKVWNELDLNVLCCRATCIDWGTSMNYDDIMYNFKSYCPNFSLEDKEV
jgi:hypothetical protein